MRLWIYTAATICLVGCSEPGGKFKLTGSMDPDKGKIVNCKSVQWSTECGPDLMDCDDGRKHFCTSFERVP